MQKFFNRRIWPLGIFGKRSLLPLTLGVSLLILIFLLWLYRQLSTSFFVSQYQRVNIGIWGKRSMIISYNINSPDHTLIIFSNSYEAEIPGGLRGYTIGAIGKLVDLEKKPLIFKKALSSAGQLLIHRTQYDNIKEVLFDDFGDPSSDDAIKSMIASALLGPGDLNVLERIFLYSRLSDIINTRTNRIMVTSQKPEIKLYERVFRNERKLVQLKYQKSSQTAYIFASMLESVGIRVSDVLEVTEGGVGESAIDRCKVVQSEADESETAKFLAEYFGCEKVKGDTGIYNIRLILDKKTEEEWGSN